MKAFVFNNSAIKLYISPVANLSFVSVIDMEII